MGFPLVLRLRFHFFDIFPWGAAEFLVEGSVEGPCGIKSAVVGDLSYVMPVLPHKQDGIFQPYDVDVARDAHIKP